MVSLSLSTTTFKTSHKIYLEYTLILSSVILSWVNILWFIKSGCTRLTVLSRNLSQLQNR